ncbi:hypothetical protein PVAND_015044 [Polypedilum vanderplanki]|uniref:Uncharacterized protein n=1 Tax=Polypedilum vanderplanki TaxID=319348 RepID=A0A9J6BBW7_POLVA|nr:hypothetical protein PVAND_015044 [Polypedilum vanderplanki]
MKFPTVNRFLLFFDLTTGGLILGYIGAITNAAFLLILLFDLVTDIQKFKNDVLQFAVGVEKLSPVEIIADELVTPEPIENYTLPLWVFVIMAVILVAILILCCFVSLWFIQGIKERDSKKVRYFLYIMAFGTFSSFIKGAFALSFSWILIAMANVYFFVCVYSLLQILEDEGNQTKEQIKQRSLKGYTQCNGIEMYGDDTNYCENANSGYQTSEFNEP